MKIVKSLKFVWEWIEQDGEIVDGRMQIDEEDEADGEGAWEEGLPTIVCDFLIKFEFKLLIWCYCWHLFLIISANLEEDDEEHPSSL